MAGAPEAQILMPEVWSVPMDRRGLLFRYWLALLIGIVGTFNMAGYQTGSKILKGFGAASRSTVAVGILLWDAGGRSVKKGI